MNLEGNGGKGAGSGRPGPGNDFSIDFNDLSDGNLTAEESDFNNESFLGSDFAEKLFRDSFGDQSTEAEPVASQTKADAQSAVAEVAEPVEPAAPAIEEPTRVVDDTIATKGVERQPQDEQSEAQVADSDFDGNSLPQSIQRNASVMNSLETLYERLPS